MNDIESVIDYLATCHRYKGINVIISARFRWFAMSACKVGGVLYLLGIAAALVNKFLTGLPGAALGLAQISAIVGLLLVSASFITFNIVLLVKHFRIAHRAQRDRQESLAHDRSQVESLLPVSKELLDYARIWLEMYVGRLHRQSSVLFSPDASLTTIIKGFSIALGGLAALPAVLERIGAPVIPRSQLPLVWLSAGIVAVFTTLAFTSVRSSLGQGRRSIELLRLALAEKAMAAAKSL
jgi:hypothetical protein